MEKENNQQKLSPPIQSIDISGNKIIFLDSSKLVAENKTLVEIEYANGNQFHGNMIGNKRHGKGTYTFSTKSDSSNNTQNQTQGSLRIPPNNKQKFMRVSSKMICKMGRALTHTLTIRNMSEVGNLD